MLAAGALMSPKQHTHTHKTNTPLSVANTASGLEYFYVFFNVSENNPAGGGKF